LGQFLRRRTNINSTTCAAHVVQRTVCWLKYGYHRQDLSLQLSGSQRGVLCRRGGYRVNWVSPCRRSIRRTGKIELPRSKFTELYKGTLMSSYLDGKNERVRIPIAGWSSLGDCDKISQHNTGVEDPPRNRWYITGNSLLRMGLVPVGNGTSWVPTVLVPFR